MPEPYRCEICLSIDTRGKHATCSITGEVVHDISKANFNCPLKEGVYDGKIQVNEI